MPEVFLKAFLMGQNLGRRVDRFVIADFVRVNQYRPRANVVARLNINGGKEYGLAGQHQILLLRLAGTVLDLIHGKK